MKDIDLCYKILSKANDDALEAKSHIIDYSELLKSNRFTNEEHKKILEDHKRDAYVLGTPSYKSEFDKELYHMLIELRRRKKEKECFEINSTDYNQD